MAVSLYWESISSIFSNAYLELEKKLKENYGDDKERQRKLDLLKYQYEEIKQAKLKEGEEEDLEDRKKIIVNAEKIADNLKEADNALGNNYRRRISGFILPKMGN